jgi:hypothetical protein
MSNPLLQAASILVILLAIDFFAYSAGSIHILLVIALLHKTYLLKKL